MPGEHLIPPPRQGSDFNERVDAHLTRVQQKMDALRRETSAAAREKWSSVPPPLSDIQDIVNQCTSDSHEWFPTTAEDLAFNALAMAGEVGEFANVVKKVMRGSRRYDDLKTQEELGEELTDVFIYLMNIVGILQRRMDFDLVEAYARKRQFNHERFGV